MASLAVRSTAVAPACLVGPPEAAPYLKKLLTAEPAKQAPGNALLSALLNDGPSRSEGKKTVSLAGRSEPSNVEAHYSSEVMMGFTQNASATFKQTGSACLDFFFNVMPLTDAPTVRARLETAWKEDPVTAMKLLLHQRAIRECGKSDKRSFFAAVMWLYQHHPQTLIANLWLMPHFGCYKDLLEVIRRSISDEIQSAAEEKDRERQETGGWREKRRAKQLREKYKGRGGRRFHSHSHPGSLRPRRVKAPKGTLKKVKKAGTSEERMAANRRQMQRESEKAALARREIRALQAARVLHLYSTNETFRRLHDEVARVFARSLVRDVASVQRFLQREEEGRGKGGEGEGKAEGEADGKKKWLGRKAPKLSLAAKWAPSLDASYDRSTLLAENIARHLFPRVQAEEAGEEKADVMDEDADVDMGEEAGQEGAKDMEGAKKGPVIKPWSATSYSSPADMSEAQYAFAARERYRKEVLAPVRDMLELPERYMSGNRWGELPYGRVPSVCMQMHKQLFEAHDKERFQSYLDDVSEGKAKIAAGAVLPHQVVSEARKGGEEGQVGELQWQRIVADMREKGSLDNCIAVCDVSGSMSGLPMEVAIALSLLIAELASEPWAGHVITFSAQPQIHHVIGATLAERAEFTEQMDWGYNTNFQAVFDGILERARAHDVPPEAMVKRLYVLSDMEFDEANATDCWATDHEEITRKFRESGYPMPEIVYWNLSQHRTGSMPVCASQPGTALVSGFSKGMLLAVMGGEEITPISTLKHALAGKMYDKVVVVD